MTRGAALLVALVASLTAAPAWAGTPANEVPLDQCSVIVTGESAQERGPAISRCLRRVLAKVAADPALADDERVDSVVPDPAALVEDLAYFDRMGGEPFHDEQGTRDRPFDLMVRFAPDQVDAAVAALGGRSWRGVRPAVLFAVRVRERNGLEYRLTADGEHGEQQRAALFAAADRFGLRVLVGTEAETGDPAARIRSVPVAVVSGTLLWSTADAGWVGEWALRDGGTWAVRGVSFDEAFRDAVGGAAHRLATVSR